MTNYLKFRGDDVALNLTFKDSAGVAIDITNYTIYFTLKKNKFDEDADAVLLKNITVHTSPTAGQTQVSLTSAETALLSGSYYYDIRYKTGAGVKKVVDSGVFTFQENISVR
jgi:archaellin